MMATVSQMGTNTLLQHIQATRLERDDVNKRLAALEVEYNNRLNQASPVSRIPLDVLVSIFQEAQSKTDSKKLPVEICVSHVCSSWRRVAIESPILWSNITLHADWLGEERITWWNGPQVLALYTSRFKKCPLRISFRFIGVTCEEYLRVLVPFRAQWQHLDLGSNLTESDDKFWELLSPSTVPLLESLRLRFRYSLRQNRRLPTTTSYPALKLLTVYSPPYESWSPSFLQLTTLTFGYYSEMVTYACLGQVLTSLPQLVNFSLASIHIEPSLPHHTPAGASQPTITHSNLQHIKLCDFSSLYRMTDHLNLPKLHTVELCDFVALYLTRSKNTFLSSVQSLIIRYRDQSDDEDEEAREFYFYDVFLTSLFPNITKLTIDALPRFPYVDPFEYAHSGDASEDAEEYHKDPEHDVFGCDSCIQRFEDREAHEENRKLAKTELPVLPFSLTAVPHGTSMRMPWPHLQTVALGEMGCLHNCATSDNLISDLRKRKLMDRPIRKVVVPPGASNTHPDHWRVLSEIADVEESYESTEEMWISV